MSYHPWFLLTADDSYRGLARFIATLETSADRWHRRDTTRIVKHPVANREQQEFREFVNQQFHDDILPRLSRYSCLLTLCAINEASVADLCRVVHRRLGQDQSIPFPQRQLLDNFPGTAFGYLGKVFKWPARIARFQSRLAALEHIRNCIAHCDGVVAKSRKGMAVGQAAKQFQFVVRGKNGGGQIHIPPGKLLLLVRECEKGFDGLYSSMHVALREAKPTKGQTQKG